MSLTSFVGVMKSKIPSRTFGATCTFELGSNHCSVNLDEYKVVLKVKECIFNESYKIIMHEGLAKFPAGFFTAGFVRLGSLNGFSNNIRAYDIEVLS